MKNEPFEKEKNVIVLVVDGLHNGYLGAYGNSWIATPGFDRLACESILFDRHYAVSLDLSLLYRGFWFGLAPNQKPQDELPHTPGLPGLALQEHYRTILLTDEVEVAHNLFAEGFSQVVLLDVPQREEPANTVEQTQFFRMFATLIELLDEASNDEKPYFLWAHFKGFSGVWDFPQQYRDEQREEGDPAPYSQTVPPGIDHRISRKRLDSEQETEVSDPDPDELRSVVEAYAAGITVFDEALEVFFDSFRSEPFGENTLLLLTASRGFSLDEHYFIGVPESGDLWSENIHIPLAVYLPDETTRMLRTLSLTQSTDICATIAKWLDLPIISESIPLPDLFPVIENEEHVFHESVRIFGNENIRAEVFPDWFFRFKNEEDEIEGTTQRIELYRKPGDRYEINEIADRCEDIVEPFLNDSKSRT